MGGSFLALNGNVSVGTSAYMALGNLIWIGGMVLFGGGAVIAAIHRSEPKKDAVGEITIEGRQK